MTTLTDDEVWTGLIDIAATHPKVWEHLTWLVTSPSAADHLRDLHRAEWPLADPDTLICTECGHRWPCRTTMWLTGKDAEEIYLSSVDSLASAGATVPFRTPSSEVPDARTRASRSLPSLNPPATGTPLRPDTATSPGHEPELQEQQVEAALNIIHHHRRLRNVRRCSGCDWRPTHPGYASDPNDTLRRHRSFNEHLARLIVSAVS